jgi:hypothetical protein
MMVTAEVCRRWKESTTSGGRHAAAAVGRQVGILDVFFFRIFGTAGRFVGGTVRLSKVCVCVRL